ncbi:MAG: carbohydrate ABC transporter permease [Thermomicrobiales bacterium]
MASVTTDPAPPTTETSYWRSGRRRRLVGMVLTYIALIVLALIFLFPLYVMVRNALMTNRQITAFEWLWLPNPPQWSNISELFDNSQIVTGLRNSAVIAIVNLIFQTLFASMAGYALARIPVPGRQYVFFGMLATLMVPGAVTFVPTFAVVSYLGGVNTIWGIVVPGLFSVFSTFLFRQFYLDFPVEIEEASRLDGASFLRTYAGIALPNSYGIMAALGALSFINSWNAFLWPLVIGRNEASRTVQVVLSSFLTAQTINLSQLFIAAVVGALPLVLVFLVLQRYIVQGVRLSGVKG